MIGIQAITQDTTKNVQQAVDKAAFRNFGHAGASISKDVKSSLEKTDGPSAPGQPPHTHKGAFMRRAIRYAATKENVVIGPCESVVGLAGEAHEFGGEFKGAEYPARPFMHPALERGAPRFAGSWAGSVGQ